MVDTVAGLASAFGKSDTLEITPNLDVEVTAVAKKLGISYSEAFRICDLGVALAVPGAPTIGVAAIVSTTQVTIPFTPPGSNGGANIDTYTATSSPGGFTAQWTGSPITMIAPFVQPVSYTFTVTATNAKGTSAASAASNAIVPKP